LERPDDRDRRRVLALLLLLPLAACGRKGALRLPEDEPEGPAR
jgi:predicted small lipoprotein YifL